MDFFFIKIKHTTCFVKCISYFLTFKELIFNTLLFADDQFIISDIEDNLQKAVYLLYNISKEYNLEIATKKTKVFGVCWNGSPKNKIYYK